MKDKGPDAMSGEEEIKKKAEGNSGGGDGNDFARELKDIKTLVAIIIIVVILAAIVVSYVYIKNQADGSSGSKTLAGKFWDMPYNLTVDQGTIPWFKEPTLLSWLSLFCGVPAAFAALWGLLKVEKDLKTVASSISRVLNVTDVSDNKYFSFKVTQPDVTQRSDPNNVKADHADTKDTDTIYEFITKHKDKTVYIHLVSGMAISGELKGYNPYAILIQTVKSKGEILVFKNSISTIGTEDLFGNDKPG